MLATPLIWRSDLHALEISSFSRPYHAVIRVFDAAGNMIETHEHAGEFKEP
jgi:hypothetical protein